MLAVVLIALGSIKESVKNFRNPYEETTTTVTETTSQNEVFKMDEASARLFELCNQARVNVGVEPLLFDEGICKVAYTRCNEQISSLIKGHTRPNGEKFYTEFYEHGLRYKSYGENIVIIRSTTQSQEKKALELWMNSDSHRENLLNPKWRYSGICVLICEEGYYAVQLFAC